VTVICTIVHWVFAHWAPLLSLLTLLAVVWYALEAHRLAETAIEQSEGPQKPCAVIVQAPNVSDDAVLEEMAASALGTPVLQIQNIGNGPAINISVRIGQSDSTLAPLAPGAIGATNHPVSVLLADGSDPIVIEYSSLSGTRYRSRAIIEKRRWVREFTFSKLTGRESDLLPQK
jgi:hypothetical protein